MTLQESSKEIGIVLQKNAKKAIKAKFEVWTSGYFDSHCGFVNFLGQQIIKKIIKVEIFLNVFRY